MKAGLFGSLGVGVGAVIITVVVILLLLFCCCCVPSVYMPIYDVQ